VAVLESSVRDTGHPEVATSGHDLEVVDHAEEIECLVLNGGVFGSVSEVALDDTTNRVPPEFRGATFWHVPNPTIGHAAVIFYDVATVASLEDILTDRPPVRGRQLARIHFVLQELADE
jgi:hypothetical protein